METNTKGVLSLNHASLLYNEHQACAWSKIIAADTLGAVNI